MASNLGAGGVIAGDAGTSQVSAAEEKEPAGTAGARLLACLGIQLCSTAQ